MELANILVALGGDKQNTVPKFGVTPAEIAVLCAIHGSDAVFDIEPTGEVIERGFREERERLMMAYTAKDEDSRPMVLNIYPGVSPVLHTDIASLGLNEDLFKPETRAKAAPVKAPAKAKAEKAAAPPPVSALAKDTSSADHLFPDDEPATAAVMG